MYEIDWNATLGYFASSGVFALVGLSSKVFLCSIFNREWFKRDDFGFIVSEIIPFFVIGYAACYFIVNK